MHCHVNGTKFEMRKIANHTHENKTRTLPVLGGRVRRMGEQSDSDEHHNLGHGDGLICGGSFLDRLR